MGFLSGLSALKTIHDLKTGKSGMLSLAQIANLIINLPDANRNLNRQQYNEVYKLFKKFQLAKTKIALHSMEDYYAIAIDVIKEFDNIAPYEMYSGASQLETSFLIREIRGQTKADDKESPDLADIYNQDIIEEIAKHIVSNSNGFATPETAEQYAHILITYQVFGKNAALKEFDSFADENWLHCDALSSPSFPLFFVNSFYIGCLYSDGIITEAEMKKMRNANEEQGLHILKTHGIITDPPDSL